MDPQDYYFDVQPEETYYGVAGLTPWSTSGYATAFYANPLNVDPMFDMTNPNNYMDPLTLFR